MCCIGQNPAAACRYGSADLYTYEKKKEIVLNGKAKVTASGPFLYRPSGCRTAK